MTERGRAARAAKNRIVRLETENAALIAENEVLAAKVADLKPRAIDGEDARDMEELQDVLSPKVSAKENARVNNAASRKKR